MTLIGIDNSTEDPEKSLRGEHTARVESLKATLLEKGFECFRSDVGGEGVKVKFSIHSSDA